MEAGTGNHFAMGGTGFSQFRTLPTETTYVSCEDSSIFWSQLHTSFLLPRKTDRNVSAGYRGWIVLMRRSMVPHLQGRLWAKLLGQASRYKVGRVFKRTLTL